MIFFIKKPTFSAILPETPESISSKIIVDELFIEYKCFLIHNINLDNSPPEAIL